MAMKARIRSPLPYGAKVDYKTEVFCTDSYPYPYPLDLEANTLCAATIVPVYREHSQWPHLFIHVNSNHKTQDIKGSTTTVHKTVDTCQSKAMD